MSFIVKQVDEDDSGDTVIVTTANYINNDIDESFVVNDEQDTATNTESEDNPVSTNGKEKEH